MPSDFTWNFALTTECASSLQFLSQLLLQQDIAITIISSLKNDKCKNHCKFIWIIASIALWLDLGVATMHVLSISTYAAY